MSLAVNDKYEDVDFNDLLAKLSEEDIEQLSLELIDPDVSYITFCHFTSYLYTMPARIWGSIFLFLY